MATSLLNRINIDSKTGCWNWIGATSYFGYGKVTYNKRTINTHRLAAHLWLGFDLNDSRMVLHKCDNPPCINPKHLFFGSSKDNVQDCINKGRFHAGAANSERSQCRKGHAYTPENTLWSYNKRNSKYHRYRRCRICSRNNSSRCYKNKI